MQSGPPQHCQCPIYPGASFIYPTPLPAEVLPQPNHGSNVRPVEPSVDYTGEETNVVPKFVPASQPNSNVQPHTNLPVGPQPTPSIQQASTSEQIAPLPSTGVNEQSTAQQLSYQPYHGSGSTYNNPVNSQTIPTATNFHSSTGEASPNGQASNVK